MAEGKNYDSFGIYFILDNFNPAASMDGQSPSSV